MHRKTLVLVILSLLSSLAWADAKTPLDARLPSNVTPIEYHITLNVDPNATTFSGETSIRVRVHEKVKSIRLHALGLSIQTVATDIPGVQAQWKQSNPAPNEGEGEVVLSQTVEPTSDRPYVTLRFKHSAPFNPQVTGLYRVQQNGRYYAYSQMEPYSARRVFPSFDEPRFKTPFNISIVAPADMSAVSNAPVQSNTADTRPNQRRWTFMTTQPLPTYLTAFMVGPFEYAQADKPDDKLRIVTPIGKRDQAQEAIKATPQLLRALEKYTGLPYAYSKLDVLAVPDFEAGAMENPGAITFRDYYLLMDSKRATPDQHARMVEIMAHELAHQWFGNLVTPRWWNDLWLNESFATWLGSKVTHLLYPAFREDAKAITSVHRAMDADALPTSRRIREPIQSYQEIHNAFDAITYLKGGAILSMFESWTGDKKFQEANQKYLKAHAHNNAEATGWIQMLSKLAGKDVVPAFDSFLSQRGLPELHATLTCEKDIALHVSQKAHTPLGIAEPVKTLWQIPFCFVYPGSKKGGRIEQCEVVRQAEEDFKLTKAKSCPAWVMPNKNGAGYFRFVMPDDQLTVLFKDAWKWLSTREKLSMMDSLSAGLSTGATRADVFGKITDALDLSTERELAKRYMREMHWMLDHIQWPIETTREKIFTASKQVATRVQRKHDPVDGELLRDLQNFLVHPLHHPSTIAENASQSSAILKDLEDGRLDETDHKSLSADDIQLKVLAGMQSAPDATTNAIQKALAQIDDGLLRQYFLRALATHPKPEAGPAILDWSLKANLRVNEQPILVEEFGDEPVHRKTAWKWLVKNFDIYIKKLSPMDVGEMPWFFTGMCEASFEKELEAVFKPREKTIPGLERHLRGAIADLRRCVAKKQFLSQAR